MFDLSIVVPVKNPPEIDTFVDGNFALFHACDLVVVDSGGGSRLRNMAQTYIRREMPFWSARKLGYEKTQAPLTLNLDADVIVPLDYVNKAMRLLEKDADAVSIFYEDVGHCQGALEYGASMWKSEDLRRLYDFSMTRVSDGKLVKVGSHAYSTLNHGWCECTYMFRKLKASGGRLETLPFRARHLARAHATGPLNEKGVLRSDDNKH
jgi:hypothetical protein